MKQNAWAREALEFTKRTLPNLLAKHGEGNEAEAMAELVAAWRTSKGEASAKEAKKPEQQKPKS